MKMSFSKWSNEEPLLGQKCQVPPNGLKTCGVGLNDRSCIADTSFLISLVNQSRTNYGVAAQYYRMILEQQVSMYFSAIVAAEFDVKQPITDLPLKNFRSIPFNVPHAREAARLWNVLRKQDDGDTRHVVRDDVNLMLFNLQNFPFEHASNSRCTLGQWHKSTDFTVFSGWNAFAKLFSMLFYPP